MGDVHHLRPPALTEAELEQATLCAAELMIIMRERPAWNWLVRKQGPVFHAVLTSPDYVPLTSGHSVGAVGSTAAEALNGARTCVAAVLANGVRGLDPMGRC